VSQGKKFDFLPPWKLIFTSLDIDFTVKIDFYRCGNCFYHLGNLFLLPQKLIFITMAIELYHHGNLFLPFIYLLLLFIQYKTE